MQKLKLEKETIRTLAGLELYLQTDRFEPIDARDFERANGGSVRSALSGALVSAWTTSAASAASGTLVSTIFGE